MAEDTGPAHWLRVVASQLRDSESPAHRRAIILAVAAAAAAAALSAGLVLSRRLPRRKPTVVGIIPARWGSSRFPGKPLAQLLGKPLIQRTWESAKLATTLSRVVVATDDTRIAECCRGFGAEVVMTSPECANGSERCAEVLKMLRGSVDIVVNIQGDEPLLEPDVIDAVVQTLERRSEAVVATAVADLAPSTAADPNRVKCVVDQRGLALYFSRALIPNNKNGTPSPTFPYMLHLGLQAFRAGFLAEYVKMPPTPLEREEQLEQLRILETGHRIAVVKVRHRGHGIDVPADIKRAEEILRKHDISLSPQR